MDEGHIRQLADPAAIYEEPVDLFVAGFMGSPPMNMLPGQLVSDGGMAVLCGEGPTALRFPMPDRIARRVAGSEGRAVVLGLRPETIFAAGTELPGPDRFVFERPVVVEEPTGPDTMIVFEIGGQDLIARVRPKDARKGGTTFRFEVEMDRAKLFDAKTGLRI
jgi:multiple sugar transport system ATP-binding protein